MCPCVRVYVRMYFSAHVRVSHIYSCVRVRANKPWHAWSTEGQVWSVIVTLHVTLFAVISPVNVKPGLQENCATLPSLSESVKVIKPLSGFSGRDPHCLGAQLPVYPFAEL